MSFKLDNITVPIAQWIARWTSNPEVVGSNPTGDDIFLQEDPLKIVKLIA